MGEKTMNITVTLVVDGESTTSNVFKIENAPKEVIVQLEKLLMDAMFKFTTERNK
jgi:hypothetical protein